MQKPMTYGGEEGARELRSGTGSVLVLSVWVLFFLAALAVAIGAYVSASVRVAERVRSDTMGMAAAKAGVEAAIAAVAGDTNDWDAFTEPWANDESSFRDRVIGDGRFSVMWYEQGIEGAAPVRHFGVRDEDGKINIRTSPTNLVAALFRVAGGVSGESALDLAGAVAGYAAGPTMLTQPFPSRYSPESTTNSGRFGSVYELRMVRGITKELFERVEPFVTVYTGNGRETQVNLNTADPVVLQALAIANGVEDPGRIVRMIMDFRRAGKFFSARTRDKLWQQLAEVDPARTDLQTAFYLMTRGNLTTVRSTCFSGVSWGWKEGRASEMTSVRFVYDRRTGTKTFWYQH